MMSNISDERLVIAAVKGDCEAIELLKDRLKPWIHNTIKGGARSYKGNIEALTLHTLEEVVNSLDSYQFIGPFRTWVSRLSINRVIAYTQQQTNAVNQDTQKSQSQKPRSKAQPKLDTTSASKKHPPLEQIDVEIRSLVRLLNQSLEIRTTCSCSGHPDRKAWETRTGHPWNPFGGWIDIVPTDTPRRALDFLIEILTKLDNTGYRGRQGGDLLDNGIRQRFQQVDANALFCSSIPIVIVGVHFRFFAHHLDVRHNLEIWKHFINSIEALILNDEASSKVGGICNLNPSEISTPEAAAKYLQGVLHQSPLTLSAKYITNDMEYPGISLHTKTDLCLLKRFSRLTNRLHQHLDETDSVMIDSSGKNPFTEQWTFALQPFLNAELIPLSHLTKTVWEPRTNEDHLKIWKLLALAVAEQLDSEGYTAKTENT